MMEITLECLGDFSSLCEEEEERFRSIDELIKDKNE